MPRLVGLGLRVDVLDGGGALTACRQRETIPSMARRFPPRLRPSRAAPPPGYPSLSAHLGTRRGFLTAVGASLLGSALPRCFVGGKPGSPDYYTTYRLPLSGALVASLREGGTCQFAVTFQAVADQGFAQADAEVAAVTVIAGFATDELTTGDGIAEAEQTLAQALGPFVDELVPFPELDIVELTS